MTFKSVESILQPDPRFADLYVVERGVARRITLADHHAAIAGIHLAGAAPADVQAALDRARSAMIYAFFDYDLFVVGEVQALSSTVYNSERIRIFLREMRVKREDRSRDSSLL